MNRSFAFLVIYLLGFLPPLAVVHGQAKPVQVSIIQLLANPDPLNGKVVAVRGYLRFQYERRSVVAAFLDVSEEDSKHMLGNEVVVVPNDQMLQSREKLDNMYVSLVGTVRVVAAGSSLPSVAIRDVQTCTRWSDPNHPIGSNRSAAATQ